MQSNEKGRAITDLPFSFALLLVPAFRILARL